MKTKFRLVFLFVFCLIYLSCEEDKKSDKETQNIENVNLETKNNDLNISILLDLSDRISPIKYPNESMEFYLRDAAYIKSVSEAFDFHLRKKKIIQMNDNIQLYFDPEPNNQNINSISNDLKYNISRKNVSLELLDQIKSVYATKPLEIYTLAIEDNEYVGSDTWRFFKNKVKDYCIEDNHRNILVILTDGYIYHKDTKMEEGNLTTYITPQDIRKFKLDNSKWKETMTNQKFGFLPATENLDNLEILVLGINPNKNNPYEEDVLIKYWKDWFNTMKVKRYEIKTAELPSNLDKIIKDFINE